MSDSVHREDLADGGVRLSTRRCSFTFHRVAPFALKIVIAGRDTGQFGTSVFNEIRFHLSGPKALELFVDASEAAGPTTEVSDAWTRFLTKEAPHLKRVTILTVSKFVHLTVSVAKLFSRTGDLIQIYSDPKLFAAALLRATEDAGRA
ncbi:MAG: hypothetical protein JO332_18440 [Planctomycetaceae bacterium]|nr:hypothetical protein [Planctomycetaceae bacterium]